jgi:O-antigen/teichoic acid export membrane protein
MIKYLAQYRSENQTEDLKSVLICGLLFEITLGTILTITSISLAGFLATTVFHRPATPLPSLIEIISITILAQALILTSKSAFTGFERTEYYSATLILQSSVKALLAPALVLLGYGALGVVLGHTISFCTAAAAGTIILYSAFYRNIKKAEGGSSLAETMKIMLKYGVPLSASIILAGFLRQFYRLITAIYCSDLLIGNYQAAVNFTMIITFFTIPISTVLFPAFSKLNPEKESETIRTVFQSSVKYTALFVIPVAAAIMALSEPLVFTIFGEKYSYAPLFLTLHSISYLYSGLGSLSLSSLLTGQGKTRLILKLTLVTIGVGIPLSLFLIPTHGITGLIATTLLAGTPSLAIKLWWTKRHYGATVDWASSTKTLIASAVAVATALATAQLSHQNWTKLALGGTTFAATYLIVVPLIRAVDKKDINNLRQMLSDLKPVYPILNIPLTIIEKLLTTTRQ